MERNEPALSFDDATAAWYDDALRGDEEACPAFLADHAAARRSSSRSARGVALRLWGR